MTMLKIAIIKLSKTTLFIFDLRVIIIVLKSYTIAHNYYTPSTTGTGYGVFFVVFLSVMLNN